MPSGHPSGLPGPCVPCWHGPNPPGVTTNSNSRHQGISRYSSPRSHLPHQLVSMWPHRPCGCKCWVSVLVRPRPATSLPWPSVSSTGKWGFPCLLCGLSWAPTAKVHPQCQVIHLGHSLRRLSSKEVKMMISKVSCGFDICYVSSVVVWRWSRRQIGGGRLESTNVFPGLPVDLNDKSWLSLASRKIKNRKRDMYLNWNFCGKEDFRHT